MTIAEQKIDNEWKYWTNLDNRIEVEFFSPKKLCLEEVDEIFAFVFQTKGKGELNYKDFKIKFELKETNWLN